MKYKPFDYQMLKNEHKCVKCKTPLPDGYTKVHCENCHERLKRYRKKSYRKKIENRICIGCDKELPPTNKETKCFKCRTKGVRSI